MNLKETQEIDRIADSIAQTALTMKDCNHVGEFEFHSKKLEKDVKRLRKISGSGTGNE